jgi:ketosteroid isomerase-like protein
MKSMPAALAVVAVLSLACQATAQKPAEKAPEKPAVDVAAEAASLRAAAKALNESTGDLEKRLSFFSDDATLLGPGQGAIVGKAAIRTRATELKALPGFTVESETKTAEVAASGDLGYTYGSGQVSLVADGKTLTLPGHSLTVWKKQGGAWKVVAQALSTTPGAETSK